MKISVIVPAYNESATVGRCLEALYRANSDLDLEVVVVDDGSADSTAQKAAEGNPPNLKVLRHPRNLGKGAAIRTGLEAVTGEIVIIQDADLEYDPADYKALLSPILEKRAQVVYGSRILRPENGRSYAQYYWGGRLLSWWTNFLFGSHITDEATCYKVFRTNLLRSLNLVCEGFEFCPEATAKLLRRKIPIVEVPIHYHPRSVEEGKKIRWQDGMRAIWTLWKYRWSNE